MHFKVTIQVFKDYPGRSIFMALIQILFIANSSKDIIDQ